jgi:hemolysin activation/secretion protein
MKFWINLIACLLLAPLAWADAPASAATNAPARASGRTFEVRGYQVEGNTLLPQAKIDAVLAHYTGPAVDVPRLTQGLGDLQLLYRRLGFATVSVTLPQQQLTNGIVHVRVIEGKLGDITIKGNHYYSEANIRRALPTPIRTGRFTR